LVSVLKKNGQAYSILVIFTNGLPADSSKTQLALKEVNDAPLSVVFIGIGAAADLEGLKGIENSHKSSGCRDSVRFVQYRTDMDPQALTLSALQDIPQQLETYFIGKNIHPGPPYVAEEIAVLPYSPVEDVEVPMVINQSTGEVTVTADVKPPDHHGASTGITLAEIKKLGKKINQNRTFQRIKYNVNSQAIYKAKCKVNRIVGHSIL
jgi:Copine